jgi:hyperosmotically inducible periplasmic protein
MKFQTIKPILGSLAIALLLSAAGCTAMTGETAGQNVDDSTITASVKTKLAADKIGSLTRIDVDTTRQVVSLNGIVDSPEQKARAEQLASQVSGVKKVNNNLQIQKAK